jgi:hypothetical protein
MTTTRIKDDDEPHWHPHTPFPCGSTNSFVQPHEYLSPWAVHLEFSTGYSLRAGQERIKQNQVTVKLRNGQQFNFQTGCLTTNIGVACKGGGRGSWRKNGVSVFIESARRGSNGIDGFDKGGCDICSLPCIGDSPTCSVHLTCSCNTASSPFTTASAQEKNSARFEVGGFCLGGFAPARPVCPLVRRSALSACDYFFFILRKKSLEGMLPGRLVCVGVSNVWPKFRLHTYASTN